MTRSESELELELVIVGTLVPDEVLKLVVAELEREWVAVGRVVALLKRDAVVLEPDVLDVIMPQVDKRCIWGLS